MIPALEEIAPVIAVHGDHDLPSAPALPSRAIVRVGGARIGLIHGKRRRGTHFSTGFPQRRGGLGMMFRGKRAAWRDQGQNLFHIRPMPAP